MAYIHSLVSRVKTFVPQSIICFQERYTFSTLRKDLLAGVTTGIIALPFTIAAASGANVAPAHGFFTAIIAGFLISALGGSRVQIGGPTSTLIVILYSILLRHGFEGMLVATILAGAILIMFGLAGLGAYIKYIPYPIVTGLKTGIAFLIFWSQIKDLLGLNMGHPPLDFIAKCKSYWDYLPTWDPITVALSCGTLALILFLRRFRPTWPGIMLTLFVMSLLSWSLHLDVETLGSRYGNLPRTLPRPVFPSFAFTEILELIPDAMSIALIAAIETLLSAVVSEGMTGWRHRSNCELVATGFANIGSALFGGLPASGSLARTTINLNSGAATPVAGMIHAIVIFLVMFLCAPLANQIPLPTLAAVLVMLAWNMSELPRFFHLFSAPKRDVLILLAVFALTVLVHITAALQIGMILAAFLFMKQMSDLGDIVSGAHLFDVQEHMTKRDPEALPRHLIPEGVEIYEINGPFFFGVADRLNNLLMELATPPKIFILRMRKVPSIDASGMHALEEFYLECQKRGILLLLAGVRKNPLQDLKRFQLAQRIGEERIFTHIHPALDYARETLKLLRFKQEIAPAT